MDNFFIEKRIYYHDTDCEGVIYYANYLKHLEEARTEFCFKNGIDLKMFGQEGIYFVVARVEIDYKATAEYGDKIKITARVEEVKRSSLVFYQEVKKVDLVLVKAKTIWVCVSSAFKPRSIPDEVKNILSG
ncbi:MAG: thioesterase family protein [Candidatus Saelkia tenebricola]|nr:thioesterase family protein [Candidatus Saelkia tenebricola]